MTTTESAQARTGAVPSAVRERVRLVQRLARRSERAEERGDFAGAATLLEEIAQLLGPAGAPREQLTVAQAAAQLGVHSRTVYRMVRTGELAHVRVHHSIRIRARDVITYLRARRSHSWRRVDRRGRPAAAGKY